MTAAVLVVVPTYDERATVEQVLDRVLAQPIDVEVLVVDDASPDGTGDLVAARAARDERVHLLRRPAKQGLGSAYRAGLRWGLDRGHVVLVEMDADLSHDPDALPALVDATSAADLVLGSRYVPGGAVANWPAHRLLLSRGGNLWVRLATGLPLRDATSGFRAFRAPVLEAIGVDRLRSEGYGFQVETALQAWRCGFAVRELPITFTERRHGASKISRSIVLEATWRVLLWGLRGPRHAAGTHPRSVRSASRG